MIALQKNISSQINAILFLYAIASTSTIVAMQQSPRKITIENTSQLNIYIDQKNILIQPKHTQLIPIDPQEEETHIRLTLPGCHPSHIDLAIGKEIDHIIYDKCYKKSNSIPTINTVTNVLVLNKK